MVTCTIKLSYTNSHIKNFKQSEKDHKPVLINTGFPISHDTVHIRMRYRGKILSHSTLVPRNLKFFFFYRAKLNFSKKSFRGFCANKTKESVISKRLLVI